MKKLYTFSLPIWLTVFMPPVVFLLILWIIFVNLISLFIVSKVNKTNIVGEIKKNFARMMIINMIGLTISTLALVITKLFSSGFIYNHLTVPLMINPFTSVISFMYILFALILGGMITFLLNNHKFKNFKLSFIIAIITIPYFFLIPSSLFMEDSINNVKNISLNGNMVKEVLNTLYSKDYYDDYNIQKNPNIININYKNDGVVIYKYLEEDASIIFNTFEKVDIVSFTVDDKVYEFDYSNINMIYKDIKKISISDIKNRYESSDFEDYEYLGNINGEYDIFDISESCTTSLEKIYEDEFANYMVSCASVDKLIVTGKKEESLIDALKNKDILIEDLYKTNIKLYREVK